MARKRGYHGKEHAAPKDVLNFFQQAAQAGARSNPRC